MARTATAKIAISVIGNLLNTLTDSNLVKVQFQNVITHNLANGLGDDQIDIGWESADRTISDGSNEDLNLFDLSGLDLGAGSGLDPLGQSVAMTELALLYINNRSAAVLTIGGAASNELTAIFAAAGDKIKIPAWGQLLLIAPKNAGFAVTTTTDALRIAASGAAATYDIIVLGRSG
ncbi:hypothetical protein IH992_22310 [Candidatus Poribacteria bacterium]|nr:hypothetical protein [Candidatus Poribacteria bacterium]